MKLFWEAVSRAKKVAWVLMLGRDRRYPEGEFIQEYLAEIVPCAETENSDNRLNIVTPTLSSLAAFGGVFTLLDLPLQAFRAGLAPAGWRVRIICTRGKQTRDEDNIGLKLAQRLGIDPALVEFHYGCGEGRPVSVGPADVFLGSLWFHFFLIRPLLEFQKDLRGGRAVPYVGLFQDYEASFTPWSSAALLARAMYDTDWPMVHLFNSAELAEFYVRQGHAVDRQFIFEPVMNGSLRKALIETPPSAKERQIIFYGRPETRRNCFYLARAALDEWSVTYPDAGAWKVISVGESYPAFRLRNGARVTVHGKLTLEDYSNQLRRSAVGLSLMSSPHPSYPPLEMAHFGAFTITNSFTCKNLSAWHENIVSVDRCDPQHLAAALSDACRRYEDDPASGLRGKSRKPGYLQDYSTDDLRRCAGLIADCLDRA